MSTLHKLGSKAAWAAVLTTLLALGGCWNDDEDETPPAPPAPITSVPDSAGASIAAFFSFIVGLSASDEASEPLTISTAFAVPADETSESTPLP